jgi:type IX secretion system PorP/SprF family membrane protein
MYMKLIKIILFILVSGTGLSAHAQQDIQFSQYVFNSLTINPAYAGYKEDTYLNAVYRKQWVGIPGSPQTGAVSLDGLPNWSRYQTVGLGGQLLWDKLGPQQSVSLYGSYAYRIPLDDAGERRLCLGIGFGVSQYSIDGNALIVTDDNDPTVPAGKVSSFKPDARFGVYYFTPSFYAGVSVMDLLSSNNIYKTEIVSNNTRYLTIRKTRHYYLTSGFLLPLSDNVKLKPSFMMKEDFKGPTNFDFNLFMLLGERLWIGGSYRTAAKLWNKNNLQPNLEQNDAASAIIELFVTDRLRAGYSYDFTTSGLAGQQSGSHEISVGLVLPNRHTKERIIGPRYF